METMSEQLSNQEIEQMYHVQRGQNNAESEFLGCLYFAPKTCKTIAFALDNGQTTTEILKLILPNSDEQMVNLIKTFIGFYLHEPDRAKELMLPYSCADLDNYRR